MQDIYMICCFGALDDKANKLGNPFVETNQILIE